MQALVGGGRDDDNLLLQIHGGHIFALQTETDGVTALDGRRQELLGNLGACWVVIG